MAAHDVGKMLSAFVKALPHPSELHDTGRQVVTQVHSLLPTPPTDNAVGEQVSTFVHDNLPPTDHDFAELVSSFIHTEVV
jgi:hypothetical protein